MKDRVITCLLAALPVLGMACLGQPDRSFFGVDGSADATLVTTEAATPDVTVVTPPDSEVEAGTPEEDAQTESGAGPATDAATELTDAGLDALADGGPGEADGATEAGCGPLTALDHCGACQNVCNTANRVDAGCGSGVCTYACAPGWSNCNTAGANTGGCACNTPTCCGLSCETTHSDGLGDTFYDCVALGTVDASAEAFKACAAYTGSQAKCKGGETCTGLPLVGPYVCNGVGGTCNRCWAYGGTDVGRVENCNCPGTDIGPWY
jgi:hypothetical protein